MSNKGPKTLVFWLLTFGYVVIVLWAALQIEPAQTAGEWGDALAGIFSPLAFLWLVYAALAQRAELELQRQELAENNETQREQQEQMRRQADAMDEQIKRLMAQADAQYQPIFVLSTSGGVPNGVRLEIKNFGAEVIDVELSEGAEFRALIDASGRLAGNPRDHVLPHWPKGASVQLDLLDGNEFTYDRYFTIEVTRLDSVRRLNKYQYLNASQRIVLQPNQDFG